MRTCGRNIIFEIFPVPLKNTSDIDEIMPEYPIPEMAEDAIVDISDAEGLKGWMEQTIDGAPIDFDNDNFDCRRYIASSIYCKSTGNGPIPYQTGCSPNYFGGLWSLACCKHDMRGNWKVKNDVFGWTETKGDVLEPKHPFFVFTYSKQSNGHQYLASLALVTRGFKSMEAYGEYLLDRGEDTEAARSRYESRYYRTNQKLTGVGYNLFLLGGI